jgi:EamA domain-containing membrane protein RarD
MVPQHFCNQSREFLMSVFFALLVLTSWVMFIWISDPDGFREAFARRRVPIPHDPKR